jgi:hypothetical protein
MRTRRFAAEKQQELKANEDAKKDVMACNNAQAIVVKAEAELSEAQPAMERASVTVDCLSKNKRGEIALAGL